MTATTPINNLRLTELTDSPPNIQTSFANFGTDVDTRLVPRFDTVTSRDSAIPSPIEGMICYVAGTGLGVATLMVYSGSAWAPLFASPSFVHKTADETVASSTAFQPDNHLTLPVRSDSVYKVEMVLLATGNDTADLKYQLTYPTGATLSGGQVTLFQATSGGVSTAGDGDFFAFSNDATSPSSTLLVGIPDTNLSTCIFKGVLVVGSTAGNLALEWAQNSSDGTGTVLKIGSYLEIARRS